MAQLDFALTGGNVMLSDGRLEPLNVGVRDGRIASITDQALDADETLDVGGLTVVPGLIDEHFHVFWGYGWETYQGATRAAAKGGITTVVDMPLDNPATLTVQRLQEKLAHVRSECHVDYALFGGYPGEDPDEVAALAEAGIVALKLFTGGVAPPGMYPGADTGQILDCMRRAHAAGLVVVVHCENAEIVDFETARLQAEGRSGAEAWDEARPWYSEVEAVQRVALAAEVTGCRTVIAHVTSHQAVEAVRDVRSRGRRRLGRDLPALPLPHDRRHGEGRPAQVEPAEPQPRVRRAAVGAAARRPRPHDRLRPRAAAEAARRRRLDAAPGCRQRPRDRCCPWSRPRPRGAASPSTGSSSCSRRPLRRLFGLYPRKGDDRGRGRRRLCRARDERPAHARCAASSSTTSRRSGRPTTGGR